MGTYYLLVRQGQTLDVRVSINGFHLHAGTTEHQSTFTKPIDRFMKPGANTLELAVLLGDPSYSSAKFEVIVGVYTSPDTHLASYDWHYDGPRPKNADFMLRPRTAEVPTARVIPFEVPLDHPHAVWLDAAEEDVPRSGSAELRAPIRELESALARGSATDVVDALSLRAAEFARMERYAEAQPAAARKLAEENVSAPFNVDSAADEELRFEPIAGGRAVRASRLTGRTAIHAVRSDNPEVMYATDVFLVRHEGRYRIFS